MYIILDDERWTRRNISRKRRWKRKNELEAKECEYLPESEVKDMKDISKHEDDGETRKISEMHENEKFRSK